MSQDRKGRCRERLRAVDTVISTLRTALAQEKQQCKALDRAIEEVVPENQMLSKDKYTIFARGETGYRKGIHKVPKWTRTPLPRTNPTGF